jgi:hypothetical protein
LSREQQQLFSQQRQQQFSKQQQEQRQAQVLPAAKRPAGSILSSHSEQAPCKRSRQGSADDNAPAAADRQQHRLNSSAAAAAAAKPAVPAAHDSRRVDVPLAAEWSAHRSPHRSSSNLQVEQQQQQQQQQQEHLLRSILRARPGLKADLGDRLAAVDQQYRDYATCKHWSGKPGSCVRDRDCGFAASQVLGKPRAQLCSNLSASRVTRLAITAGGRSLED